MRRLALAVTAFVVGSSLSAGSVEAQKGDRTRLLPEEMATKPDAKNAYDAIRALRPNFLRVRPRGDGGGTSNPSGYNANTDRPEPALFVDETRYDRLDELKNIPVTEVSEIRLLSESEANGRFGSGYPYGVIMVTTTRRK